MSLLATVALLLVGLGLCAVCRWHEAHPPALGEIRLFPSTLAMAVGVVLVVVALAHLVSLLSGVPLRPRNMG